tara:strand:+ start:8083 stop:9111 length:1029 start_codon:yes stop_codon:yes gene_type:complete
MLASSKILFLFFFLFSTGILVSAQDSTEMSSDTLKYGIVILEFNTDSALAVVNNQYQEPLFVKNGDSIKVKTGNTSIKLSVIHDYIFEKIFNVIEDSIYNISHDFEFLPLTKKVLNGNLAARQFFNANLLVITDEESDIYLNDELVGREFAYLDAPTGTNSIQAKSSTSYQSLYISNRSRISNSAYYFRIVERYIKPKESTSKALAFLPGFSQAYKYQGNKASLIRISMGTTFLSLSTFSIKYRLDKNKYDDLLDRYNNSVSNSEVTALGDQLVKKEKSLHNAALIRNISLYALSGIYIYNVLDGLFNKPKSGYRKTKPYSFYLGSDELSSLSFNFNLELGN